MKLWLSAIAALTLVLTSPFAARAQEKPQEGLTAIIVSRGDAAFKQLVSQFEAKTGLKVNVRLLGFVATRDAIVNGEPFDVGIVEFPHDTAVIASGNVVPSSEVSVANGQIGLAVRNGAPKADISTPAAVKRTLLAAKSIAYPNPNGGTGASGVNISMMLRRLGIAEQVKAKTILTRGGRRAMAMVANGEAEIGMTYLIGMGGDQMKPGLIDIVGTLPPEIAPPVPMIGFVSSKTTHPAAARELLKFLTSPEAEATYAKHWLQPGY
jgi:molybdate transport system substrate-binding protein